LKQKKQAMGGKGENHKSVLRTNDKTEKRHTRRRGLALNRRDTKGSQGGMSQLQSDQNQKGFFGDVPQSKITPNWLDLQGGGGPRRDGRRNV